MSSPNPDLFPQPESIHSIEEAQWYCDMTYKIASEVTEKNEKRYWEQRSIAYATRVVDIAGGYDTPVLAIGLKVVLISLFSFVLVSGCTALFELTRF